MTETKKAIEVFTEVEEATAGLEDLPRVIELIFETYKLNREEITSEDALNMILGRGTIYATLSTVQMRLCDIIDKLQRIDIKKDLTPEHTETTK